MIARNFRVEKTKSSNLPKKRKKKRFLNILEFRFKNEKDLTDRYTIKI